MTPAASADESYRVTLGAPAKIGNADFRAGAYRITVDGPKIVFTEVSSGKAVEVTAKVENADKKSPTTEIHTRQNAGVNRVSEIRFGGSKTRIVFD